MPGHLRRRPVPPHAPALHCFVLDCSGSMLCAGQLARAKGVLAELLAQAYRWRDPVALLGFGGAGSTLVLAPGRALQDAGRTLAPLGGGGGTPLTQALADADALLRRHRQGQRWLWLLTDGRTRERPARPRHADWLCVIDFDTARPPLGRAPALAAAWDARHLRAADVWA
ncbi:VWA domain-containing protein [Melaminivora sp.]|uniref:vWA domain-containing protein n=1 Tax=Melaminivora sp. TaxID=1933032 RepID=UPI0028AD0D1C|nr:VWA domain-containing protein [Melaminivora sp.]